MPDHDEHLAQGTVDFRNEERRSSHYEISPREREDEQRRGRGEFDAYVCAHPFEDWIQDILDQRKERGIDV